MFLCFENDGNIFELFNLIFALNKIAFINGQNTKKTERNTLDDATLLIREGDLSNKRFGIPLTDMQDIVEFDPFGNRLADFFVELATHNFTDTNEIINFFVRKIVIPYVLTTSGAIQNWGNISEKMKNKILKYYAGWLINPETKQIRCPEEMIRIVGKDNPTEILIDFRKDIDSDFN